MTPISRFWMELKAGRVRDYSWRKPSQSGDHLPKVQNFDAGLGHRPLGHENRFQQQLEAGCEQQFHFTSKNSSLGKSSPLPAGQHEGGFECTARNNRVDPHCMRVISRRIEISE